LDTADRKSTLRKTITVSSQQSPLNLLEVRNDAVHVSRMKIVGLFAGIGGFEHGLMRAGHDSELLCEIDEHARSVLHARFPGIQLKPDVELSRWRGVVRAGL
jgi:hypothetical protein